MKAQLSSFNFRFQKLFHEHEAFVVIIGALLILTAVFLRINTLSNKPVDQSYLTSQSSTIQSVRFNEDAIEQIKQLNESNVNDPGTQLPGNRQNPFNE